MYLVASGAASLAPSDRACRSQRCAGEHKAKHRLNKGKAPSRQRVLAAVVQGLDRAASRSRSTAYHRLRRRGRRFVRSAQPA